MPRRQGPLTGSADSFHRVTEAVPIPVLIAGGPSDAPFSDTLAIVEQGKSAGGAGVCMGRQVFGSQDPSAHVAALRQVVHEGASAADAAATLRG